MRCSSHASARSAMSRRIVCSITSRIISSSSNSGVSAAARGCSSFSAMSVLYQFHNGVGRLPVLGKEVIHQRCYEPENDSGVLDPIWQLTGQHDRVASMP
jgi:hypothetical protein